LVAPTDPCAPVYHFTFELTQKLELTDTFTKTCAQGLSLNEI